MFAHRYHIAAFSFFLIAGTAAGQERLYQHAGPHPALSPPIVVGHGDEHHTSDAMWQHESPSHHDAQGPMDLHVGEIHEHGTRGESHGTAAEAHGTAAEAHGAAAGAHAEAHAAPAACSCGTKHCHGVCRDPGHPAKPKREMPGDVDRGDCPPKRYLIPDCKRAGNPHCVAPWAKCSVDGKYSSWFVGGGAAFFRGRCRQPDEGTWGLDYNGFFGHANVWLNYTRGRKQGGEGAYQTDGEPEFVSKAHSILGLGH